MRVDKLFFISNRLFAGIDVLARRRLMSILVVFFLSFGGSLVWGFLRGIPLACVQDEYSYLLAGDTFAHGRMTNPMHPLWEYFETFHVLQHPSNMTKYQAGQGVFLAIGQKFLGHPIYGVWLSDGLMCAAICWMLYAWVSPRWALIGGLVAVLQFGIFTYWSQSYWGGAVAGLGGALVFGALPRVFQYQRLRDTLLLGLGIGILANTRPLEGILISIPMGCVVLPWKIQWQGVDKRRLLKNTVLPLALLILAAVMLTCTYNKKVTGHALLLPRVLYEKQYSSIPVFLWQPLGPAIHYNYQNLENDFKNRCIRYYLNKRTWKGFAQDMFRDSVHMGLFYLYFPLALPALFVICMLLSHRRTALRLMGGMGILLFYFGLLICVARAHYIAPITCLAVLLITAGLRYLSCLTFKRLRIGTMLVIFLVLFQLGFNLFLNHHLPVVVSSAAVKRMSNGKVLPETLNRQELKDMLLKIGGKHLVIVKYPPRHDCRWEWIYNEADIDHSPIVWARDMGGSQGNARLLDYYKDRQVWEVTIIWDYRAPYLNELRL